MNLGPHASFIIGAYAIAAAVIAIVIAWVVLDYRRQLRILSELEEGGVTRRSGRTGAEKAKEQALP
jgi:heme exporter protein D